MEENGGPRSYGRKNLLNTFLDMFSDYSQETELNTPTNVKKKGRMQHLPDSCL